MHIHLWRQFYFVCVEGCVRKNWLFSKYSVLTNKKSEIKAKVKIITNMMRQLKEVIKMSRYNNKKELTKANFASLKLYNCFFF